MQVQHDTRRWMVFLDSKRELLGSFVPLTVLFILHALFEVLLTVSGQDTDRRDKGQHNRQHYRLLNLKVFFTITQTSVLNSRRIKLTPKTGCQARTEPYCAEKSL